MNVSIIYWSQTGNTERMAELIAEGAREKGAEVSLKSVDSASMGDVVNADIVVLGCPAMGDEVLEESEFEPFMEEIESKLSGKKLALFGSYSWGDGQWMRDWVERMNVAGAILLNDGLIVNEEPDDEGEAASRALGATIVG